jgi:hypothetical protein
VRDDNGGRGVAVTLYELLMRVPGFDRFLPTWNDRLFARQFKKGLARFNDVLEQTELAGRYWVFSGMLLGWAREGDLLPRDRDADFGILPDDVPRLMRAVPKLVEAGFLPHKQFRTNDGKLVELMFLRRRAVYDFSIFFPRDGELQYFMFGWPPDQLVEVEKRLPVQNLVRFAFLGRTWLRHEDYVRELELNYGDWRTPHRGWNYLTDGPNMVSSKPWVNTDTSWRD